MIENSRFIVTLILLVISAVFIGFCIGSMVSQSIADGREEALLEEITDPNMGIYRISKRLMK